MHLHCPTKPRSLPADRARARAPHPAAAAVVLFLNCVPCPHASGFRKFSWAFRNMLKSQPVCAQAAPATGPT
jgi:hypothetical protein